MDIKAIFAEGMKERRRRAALRKEKKNLDARQKAHGGFLTALGQKAWQAKAGLAGAADLQEKLAAAQQRHDEQGTRDDELQMQARATAEKKKKEDERFDAACREVEENKKGVDARLNEEKTALKAVQREAEQAAARLAQIPLLREQLNRKSADAQTPDTEKREIPGKLAALVSEEKELQARYQEKTESAQLEGARIAPIQAESDQLQKRIDEIRAEQKKVTAGLEQILAGLNKESAECRKRMLEAEKELQAGFRQLGEKLAAANASDPALAAEMAAVRTTGKEVADARSRIESLEAEKTAAGASAYRKMVALLLSAFVLVAALVIILALVL